MNEEERREKERKEVEEIGRGMMCLTCKRAPIKSSAQKKEFPKKVWDSSNEGTAYGKILSHMYF